MTSLDCVMPWKAFYMDECDGKLIALPCCLGWIEHGYGTVGSASLGELWNSEGAQRIRRLLSTGRQSEVCSRHCPHWMSGRYGESALRIVDGPAEFVSNQELNLVEIRERGTILRSKPMLLKLLPTLHCNLQCSMCFQDHQSPFNLGKEFWHDIGVWIPCAHEIAFQGGEVTLDEDFRNFLDSSMLREHRHIRISLITNGTVLDDRLLGSFNHVRLNYVVVSLNSASREIYLRITKRDLFDHVVNNLRKWVEFAGWHPLGRFTVYVSFVVMRSNFRELPQFLRLAQDLGAEVQLLEVTGNRQGENVFAQSDLRPELRRIIDQACDIALGLAAEQVGRIRDIFHSQYTATSGG